MASKNVFITGASSGIGKAVAIYFAQNGWGVAATMRTPEKETELTTFPNVKLYALDVTLIESVEKTVKQAITDFGAFSVVVNNAGYGVDGVFEAMTDAVIQRQFDTNVLGLMRVTRAFISHFREKGGGTFIQIASMGGRLTFPLYSIYHGTKWAVEGFTESLQYELRPFNIKMRLVEPGVITTDFYGRSRVFIKPETTQGYDKFVEKCAAYSMETGKNGISPDVVAKTVMKAATDSGWKLRYPSGAPAPSLLWIRKRIPDWLYFFMVKMSYKL